MSLGFAEFRRNGLICESPDPIVFYKKVLVRILMSVVEIWAGNVTRSSWGPSRFFKSDMTRKVYNRISLFSTRGAVFVCRDNLVRKRGGEPMVRPMACHVWKFKF